jgi:hypothetical protein
VLDSCHSGTATRALAYASEAWPGEQVRPQPRFLPPAIVDPSERGVMRALAVESKPVNPTSRASVPLLAACAPDEVAWDANFNGRARGAFTAAAIQALESTPPNLGEWQNRIRGILPSATYPQNPQLNAAWWQRYWRPFA